MQKSKKVKIALAKVGHDLSLARRRRHISMQSMAQRLGISVSTLGRMEKGDPTVAWGTVAGALEIFGLGNSFENLADSSRDELGLGIMDSHVPRRIRQRVIKADTGAL